ncbi:anthranilate synthase component II [Oceanirhabdus seepicola]|uniref:Aminodeoxychorismate/anthranilate synthase component II n=1 Tax=Oceanirhabdus seepicola TaxID=2828781 RepID=A0A9J6P2M7_9CLOT|nr:aminodeoxychorismate/anthranilate synthase component II [Oceanirhabdus seepicola]MCM1990636.1 aminodeoxychorismate/anthranilate synthase component II [Oceanirhabdus seepicola]
MFIMIDNYDSFVYNLVRYVKELGEDIKIYRNDKVDINLIRESKPEGIIISPGPGTPQNAGISSEIINEFKGKIPILGICLGHQTIAHEFGGKVIKGEEPVHGKVQFINNDGKGVFRGLPKRFNVTRYHSLVVENEHIPESLMVTAETDDGTIMGIRHKQFFIEGVQFHPEAELTEFGHEMIKNFIENCRERGALCERSIY